MLEPNGMHFEYLQKRWLLINYKLSLQVAMLHDSNLCLEPAIMHSYTWETSKFLILTNR